MPQDLADLRHGRAVANHSGGQAVPEQVRSATARRAYPGTPEGQAYDMVDRRRARQPDTWRQQAHKDAARCAGAGFAEVASQRLANIGQQRQMFYHPALAVNDDLP